jgi:XTP/dITP diphosphohydrolase
MRPSRPHAPPRRLIIATGNPGKLREFQALLEGLAFVPCAQASVGVPAPEETGATFLANALLKARHASAATGEPAIADDSGLEVDALGGAPGIYSARYAGPGADDAANNAKLLRALAGIAPARRQARYRCVLVYVDGPDDSSRGGGGFGYDPYFWLPELRMTAAELDPDEKNRLSHRGRAMRDLRLQLEARHPGALP